MTLREILSEPASIDMDIPVVFKDIDGMHYDINGIYHDEADLIVLTNQFNK